MKERSVVVIGAGAAGLAAAEVLAREGQRVTLLEGRSRIGGRMHTIRGQGGTPPIELGAEFIHGESVCTWEMVRAAGSATQPVTDRHWWFTNGALTEEPGFWEKLEHVTGKVNDAGPDSDVATFLAQAPGLSASARTLAKEYVEGFHAAPVDRMSVHAFARAEGSGEGDEGMKQFRLTSGYGALLDWFGQQLAALGVEIRLETVVRRVGWERGRVEIVAQTPAGPQSFAAPQALVTLPLGVLQVQGPEAVVFEPRLEAKAKAIEGLGVGAVVKLTLQFESRFWPVEDFGFIHAPGAAFPTWWSDARGPVVTGWVGGPRAERLGRESREALVAKALRALAGFFQMDVKRVQELLVAGSTYDWLGDPFARGAYSFPPVGMDDMPKLLGAPMFDTLFFAGEATDPEGDLGTVHGALASGRRAAREVLAVKRL